MRISTSYRNYFRFNLKLFQKIDQTNKYLGITVHFVDALFQMKSLTLSLRHYLGSHTGVNLKDLDQLVDKLVEKFVPNL